MGGNVIAGLVEDKLMGGSVPCVAKGSTISGVVVVEVVGTAALVVVGDIVVVPYV